MRLKSPFSDYYDGCIRLDQEAEPLYVRKTQEERLSTRVCSIQVYPLITKAFVIGVGNFVTRGLKLSVTSIYGKRSASSIAYSVEDVEKFCATHMRKKHADLKNWPNNRRRFQKNWPYPIIEQYFNPLPGQQQIRASISTREMPIWVLEQYSFKESTLLKNPRLASYGFACILPPYQAYQELRTYLCNQAAPREYIPPVSDADMLEAKGFDPQTSFRQVSPGGPARKRRKKDRKRND